MSYLAPAGTPISASDLWRWLYSLSGATNEMTQFRQTLRQTLQLAGCEFVSSGRAGMTLLLRTLHRIRGETLRNEVVVPGYTCYSVPGSIEKAGLKVRVCDIDPVSLSYDLEQLRSTDFSRVLAIVTANLYGIPNDLPAIEAIAAKQNVFLVDDAAQALGATMAGRWVGTFGDIGLFSLDKGKNITSLQGGILVTKHPAIAEPLAAAVGRLPQTSKVTTLSYAAKLLFYAALLHPTRYGMVRKLPFLELGKTPYTTEYPLCGLSPVLGAMAHLLFQRLDAITAARRANGRALIEALADLPNLQPVIPPQTAEPVYLRLPILAETPRQRDSLLNALDAAGIGATPSYPAAVADIPDLQGRLAPGSYDTPAARDVAARIITLPTHPYVTSDHIRQVRGCLKPLQA
ncbi:MAG: hypothetical protein DWQ09_07495 [Proteobacteria bacterium]|nr:MAG: hypothetical protein DWQ09_07495 [Pseudomonadota bacterium]QKK12067.1 MAG: hypothetical protein HND59_11235 [Pseudomonadota bacterium]